MIANSAMAKDIHIKINGMSCSLCSKGISKNIQNIKNIKNFEVDMENKMVFLSTNEGKDISDLEIKNAISNAGYMVVKIERK